MGQKGKRQSIKTLSDAYLRDLYPKELLQNFKAIPSVAKTLTVTSSKKRKYCFKLIKEMKNQAQFDQLFDNISNLLQNG